MALTYDIFVVTIVCVIVYDCLEYFFDTGISATCQEVNQDQGCVEVCVCKYSLWC